MGIEFLDLCVDVLFIRKKGLAFERKEMSQNIINRYFVYVSIYMVLVLKFFKIGDFNVK